MSSDLIINNINEMINNVCNQLLSEHRLITTKAVISILSTLDPGLTNYTEEFITNKINAWRVNKLSQKSTTTFKNSNIASTKEEVELANKQSLSDNLKYRKQLLKATREVQILKAKIQALKSFYNRQRKEIIMKVEGMLYNSGNTSH